MKSCAIYSRPLFLLDRFRVDGMLRRLSLEHPRDVLRRSLHHQVESMPSKPHVGREYQIREPVADSVEYVSFSRWSLRDPFQTCTAEPPLLPALPPRSVINARRCSG